MDKVCIIIVAYNSMKWADRCYQSLRNQLIKCHILTIDNGSTDGTQKYIRENYPEVELIETGANLGFGKANNIGLQKVIDEKFDYAYLLNQDAWLLPDTLQRLVEISKEHPDYGIISPMQLKSSFNTIDEDFLFNIPNEYSKKPNFINDSYFGKLEPIYETSFVMAAHWLITRKCIQAVGGFSPTFPHYGEDNNWIHRCLYNNFKIGIAPNINVVHDRKTTMTQEKRNYLEYYINTLVIVSNPNRKQSLMHILIRRTIHAIRTRNKVLIGYVWRIFKERREIERNNEKQLYANAFLKL